MVAPPGSVTQLLSDWGKGDQKALDRLMPLVYKELHQLASRYMRSERPGNTLQSTALVSEAYLKLAGSGPIDWQNRAHFFGVAAKIIRHILLDHSRARRSEKRGGGSIALSLDEALTASEKRDVNLEVLDDALKELAKIDPQQSRIVELRFFAGLSIEETAEVLKVSRSTVKRDWVMARTWIFREIARGSPGASMYDSDL
jgi:RNA polymerase sigma factor (TIGR02999 family)